MSITGQSTSASRTPEESQPACAYLNPFDAGYEGFFAGMSVDANPYETESGSLDDADAWERGWSQAKQDAA